MKKFVMAAALVAAGAFAGSANAVVLTPANISATNSVADGVATSGVRTDVDNAFDGSAATFYSLGVGGSVTVDVSPLLLASPATVLEVTFNSPNPNFPESAQIFVGGVLAGEIFNQQVSGVFFTAEAGFSIDVTPGSGGASYAIGFANGVFSTLTILDTTFVNFAGAYNNNPANSDGFDVAEISVSTVPVPAALPLLASAIAGVGFWSRRRKHAAK